MSQPVYEAQVYARTVSYRNFRGEEQTHELMFALDPIQLLEFIAKTPTPKASKSKNPARRGVEEIDESKSFTFLREIASVAAGSPSDDGESWEPFDGFIDSLVGKAFITKLASSDDDRKEFAEKVMLAPFRAFVEYAKADGGNSPKEIAKFEQMLEQFERIFAVSVVDETLADRKARLAAEMAALDAIAEDE